MASRVAGPTVWLNFAKQSGLTSVRHRTTFPASRVSATGAAYNPETDTRRAW